MVTKKTTVTEGDDKADGSQTSAYIVYFIFGVIEILLAFRIIFKISGANPGSGFVSTIYSLTQMLILPFSGIFRQATTAGIETTAVLEPSAIVALAVYAVVGWGIVVLLGIMAGKTK